ncbi:quinone oxidoreductase family protein [Pontibacter sp. MBLB2868]|uniref:quinone oxidoreductase family protein n=1 Tax=Pontibacter sp. MBLB2868 TaxID=3451555 RepID=UPI003F74EEBD
MKALIFKQAGVPADVLHYEAAGLPEVSPQEVLVKVLASPINPADVMFIQGKYRQQAVFPQIAGLEAAGIVVKAGGSAAVQTGSLVAFRTKGCWAEYVQVPVDKLYALPPSFPVQKACQFALNPVTAWALLYEAKVAENDWLLVTAGSSTVARIMIQLARAKGVRVIAAIRGLNEREELMRLGAAAVVDVLDAKWPDTVLRLTENKGVTAALDAVGGGVGAGIYACVGTGGIVLLYGLLSPDKVQYHNADIIMKLLTVKGFGLDNWLCKLPADVKASMEHELIHTLAAASFRLEVGATFPFAQYREAFEAMCSGLFSGKILFWNHTLC